MAKSITMVIPKEEMEKQFRFSEEINQVNMHKKAMSGIAPRAFVKTFGCQMNEHDSEKIKGMLVSMGYGIVDEAEGADIVVFNTCCVRENAEDKVFGHIGLLKWYKRRKPDMIIAICGCMTEEPHIVEKIRKKYKHVDLCFGTHNLHRLPELVYRVMNEHTNIYEVSRTENEVAEGVPVLRESKIKAWVTIMYGCDNYCTYCIVPYVRGHERSRRAEDIISEIKQLCEEGIKEITLLGQNVNSYGKDLPTPVTFAELLDRICKETDIARIRFLTSHPKDLSDEVLNVMAENARICRQLHLPVQSGSSRLLAKMNRHYTKEQYLEIVKKARERMPEIGLTTDIIVGFPGETEEDFSETLALVAEARYDQAFTFIYSKRTGTPAAKYPDQVPEEVVKERFDRLLELQNRISREINEKFDGAVLEVLCEGKSKTNEDKYTGRTSGNKIVNFDSETDVTGKIVNVKIDSVQTWSLEGKVI